MLKVTSWVRNHEAEFRLLCEKHRRKEGYYSYRTDCAVAAALQCKPSHIQALRAARGLVNYKRAGRDLWGVVDRILRLDATDRVKIRLIKGAMIDT